MDNIICGVYMFTDSMGKRYIGQSKNIWERYGTHYSDAFHQSTHCDKLFYQALRDHPSDFTFEILEECSVSELNARESYWITYYNSIENGYNIRSNTGYDVYTLDGQFYQHYDSIKQAITNLHLPDNAQGNIYKCYSLKTKSAYGYIWRHTGDALNAESADYGKTGVKQKGMKRKVYQYDTNHNLIQVYESSTACAKALGVAQASVSRTCLGKQKSCKGFVLTYNEEIWE